MAEDPAFYDLVQNAASSQLQQQAFKDLGTVAITGLGAGAGLRGLLGLLQLSRRNTVPKKDTGTAPIDVILPIEKEEKLAGFLDFIKGQNAETVRGIPWYTPAVVGTGALAAGGGWKVMDWILDRRRKAEADKELEAAKAEFESALHETSHKTSCDGELNRNLSDLYHCYEKAASTGSEIAGQLAGGYGLWAGTTGLIAALLAYQWGQKRQTKKLVEKALIKRRQQRYLHQPSALFASPVHKEKTSPAIREEEPFKPAPSLESEEDQLQ